MKSTGLGCVRSADDTKKMLQTPSKGPGQQLAMNTVARLSVQVLTVIDCSFGKHAIHRSTHKWRIKEHRTLKNRPDCERPRALLNPEMSLLIQKRHPYTGNLNSETSGDSKNASLHCGDVLGDRQRLYLSTRCGQGRGTPGRCRATSSPRRRSGRNCGGGPAAPGRAPPL